MSGTNGDQPPPKPGKLLKLLILKSLSNVSLGTITNSLGIQTTPKLNDFCQIFQTGLFSNGLIALNGGVNNPYKKKR